MVYSAAIVGAGQIALGYDSPEGALIRTHAKAFSLNPAIRLIALCDRDPQKAKDSAQLWSIPNSVSRISDLTTLKPEIVSVCTPDDTHEEVLEELLKVRPKVVFCEKPLGIELARSRKIVEAYENSGVSLVVNYSRRFWPTVQSIRKNYAQGRFGHIISARVKYYASLRKNGSHCFDLLQAVVAAKLISGSVYWSGTAVDNSPRDVCSGILRMRSEQAEFFVVLEGYDPASFGAIPAMPLELEIVFSKARILFEERNGGRISISELRENEYYPGYFEFGEPKGETIGVSLALEQAVEHLIAMVDGTASPLCAARDALETMCLIEQIRSLPLAG